MNDITRKFLEGILQQVEEQRIVELRLFPAMRQGGIESAVAVLAVEPKPVLPESSEPSDEALDIVSADEAVAEIPAAVAADRWDAEELSERVAELRVDFEGIQDAEAEEPEPVEMALPMPIEQEREVDIAALADEAVAEAHPDDVLPLQDILALPEPEPNPVLEQVDPRRRLEIISARYRYVFKGPDRGKWLIEVVHEADAPFETLERVVNGVVRRSGEESDPARYSAVSLREALNAPAWA